MKKLLIGGCSFSHGAELVDGFMHPQNIEHSYSRHLANWLDVDLINIALSGASNDYIFHSLINEMEKYESEDMHSVIAAWTGVNRLHWINKNRHWFFIPGWASSMCNVYDWEFHQHPTSAAFITADNANYLDLLEQQHKFFVDNYLDDTETLSKKLVNYKLALEAYCKNRDIKLFNIDIVKFLQQFALKGKHPDKTQHKKIAHDIYNAFYCMDQR